MPCILVLKQTCIQFGAILKNMVTILLFLKLTDEREKPELLAESRERRRRVAKESGKTEQQVCVLLFLKLS